MSDKPQVDFNLYCRTHAVWLIKYSSDQIQPPIFFIWYKDENDQDRSKFLTHYDSQIFCTHHIGKLIESGFTQYPTVSPSTKITQFVDGLSIFKSFTLSHFDMSFVMKELDHTRLTDDLYAWITDFIYLVGDYSSNNKNGESLTTLLENPTITSVIQYYNDFILWPSLHGTKIEASTLSSHPTNTIELATILRQIIAQFEEKIKI
jgi:hypothetical protein